MATRGAYGYHLNGVDKVIYNHFDSYPDMLYARILNYISQIGYENMCNAAMRIILVNKGNTAEQVMVVRHKFYANWVGSKCLHSNLNSYDQLNNFNSFI